MSVTIINGGTQGLGEAVARKLVADGGATGLVLAGRSADRGQALADELTGLGTRTIFVQSDIADPAAPARDRRRVRRRVRHRERVGERRREDLAGDAVHRHARAPRADDGGQRQGAVLPDPGRRDADDRDGAAGSIVNVGSTSQYGGQTKLTSYVMSKAALVAMTKNLAFGLMRHNIRVNQVSPGWMDTESEHVHPGDLRRRARELARAGRGEAARWVASSSRGRSRT